MLTAENFAAGEATRGRTASLSGYDCGSIQGFRNITMPPPSYQCA